MNLSNNAHTTSFHTDQELQLFCFSLEENGDLYAINVLKVQEIIRYKDKITKVSYDKSSIIEGLISIRGIDIPLLDMRKWLYYNPNTPDQDLTPFATHSKENELTIMICEFSQWKIGIKLYQENRILSKKWNELKQEIDLSGNLKNGKFIHRTRYFDHQIVQVIDIEKMLLDVFPWITLEEQRTLSHLQTIQSKKVILFADDSPAVLKTVQRLLEHLGLKYYSFHNGEVLLDFIQRQTIPLEEIGLIITDLEMPQKSGFDVIRYIKENPLTSHIPVIVNSSMGENSNQEMVFSLQANGFIAKPNPQGIETMIKYYLEEK